MLQLVADKHGSQKYKIIKEYILKKIGGREIVLSDRKEAVVDKSDANHIANNAGTKKTAQISKIIEIVKKSELIAEEKSTKENKFTDFYYYETFVKFDKEPLPVYLNVGRAKNDGTYHIYDITQKLRDTAHRVNDVGRPVGYALKNGISNNSISNNSDSVKKNELFALRDEVERVLATKDASKHRMNVDRCINSMWTWIKKPTKTRHVPDTLKESLNKLLKNIRDDVEFSQSMLDLADVLNEHVNENMEAYVIMIKSL